MYEYICTTICCFFTVYSTSVLGKRLFQAGQLSSPRKINLLCHEKHMYICTSVNALRAAKYYCFNCDLSHTTKYSKCPKSKCQLCKNPSCTNSVPKSDCSHKYIHCNDCQRYWYDTAFFLVQLVVMKGGVFFIGAQRTVLKLTNQEENVINGQNVMTVDKCMQETNWTLIRPNVVWGGAGAASITHSHATVEKYSCLLQNM